MPALITVEREAFPPRVAPMDCILESYSKTITAWGRADLPGSDEDFGLRGSPTKLRKVYTPKLLKGEVHLFEGGPEDVANQFVETLKEKFII